MRYAGFWIRFCAAVIDSFVFFPFGIAIGVFEAAGFFSGWTLASWVVAWLYSALMESGGWQATIGKRIVGIRVTDLNGNRITFGRATGRHFAKFISWVVLYIGYIMVAFTDKKQGLHDILAGTLVVHGNATTALPDPIDDSINVALPETESQTAPRYVIAGFDSNGHVVRLSFRSDDPGLEGEGLKIGRDGTLCSLVLTDTSISRVHARLFKKDGEVYIEDLGSTNGTSLEGRALRANSSARFPPNGNITLGEIDLSIGKY